MFYLFYFIYYLFVINYLSLEYVKIKLLHSSELKFKENKNENENENLSFFKLCFRGQHKNYTKNSIIFHVHGGGFVAMSSSSHENYTRKYFLNIF